MSWPPHTLNLEILDTGPESYFLGMSDLGVGVETYMGGIGGGGGGRGTGPSKAASLWRPHTQGKWGCKGSRPLEPPSPGQGEGWSKKGLRSVTGDRGTGRFEGVVRFLILKNHCSL